MHFAVRSLKKGKRGVETISAGAVLFAKAQCGKFQVSVSPSTPAPEQEGDSLGDCIATIRTYEDRCRLGLFN